MLKQIIYTFFLLMLFAFNVSAQQPEKIYGKNKVLKPNEYYIEQMALWKNVLNKEPHNADAWLNYYRANRNAYIKGEEGDNEKAKGLNRFDRLKSIVDSMEKKVPDSFEFNFVKWSNGNNDFSLFPYLAKAQQLSPKNTDVQESLLFYYTLKNDTTARNTCIRNYYSLGDFSPGLLNYSYNLLAGLNTNAIVLTEGDKDTEVGLLLQYGKGYRTDILILNVGLLLRADYRESIFKQLNVPPLNYDPLQNDENYLKFKQTLVSYLAQHLKNRTIYIAVNVQNDYTSSINKYIYLTGLAYQYSTIALDASKLLRTNIEEHYAMDYLRVYFPNDISIGNVHSMNENYIQPMGALYTYYLKANNPTKAEYYKKLAQHLAVEADRQDLYNTYFSNN